MTAPLFADVLLRACPTQDTAEIRLCSALHRQGVAYLDGTGAGRGARGDGVLLLCGTPVRVDEAVPRNEVWLLNGRREVVKIINLGDAP